MKEKTNDKIEKLIELGEEIYDHSQNAEAILYLGYALGLAKNKKE